MTFRQLSYDFISGHVTLTWREAEWGVQHKLIGWEVVKALVADSISSDSDQKEELSLLWSDSSSDSESALRKLAASEPEEAEERIRSRWLRLILSDLFSRRSEVADPLAEVEDIYADFDYPKEMESFVRYMPASDGYDPLQHSHQENIDRLYRNWSNYVHEKGS